MTSRYASMMPRLITLTITLLMAATAPVMAEDPASEPALEDLQQELEEQKALNEHLQQRLNAITTEITGDEPGKKPKDPCPAEVVTFVRDFKGDSCDTYKAEIAGWASECVKQCDQATRLQVAVASASKTCKEFCNKRNCEPFSYDPPKKCADYTCEKAKQCAPQCPFLEECFLEQAARRWNCMCIEL